MLYFSFIAELSTGEEINGEVGVGSMELTLQGWLFALHGVEI